MKYVTPRVRTLFTATAIALLSANVAYSQGAVGVAKVFSPALIDLSQATVATITLSNPNASIATLTAAFVDTLPTGLAVSGTASSTCGTPALSQTATSVTLAIGATIPANGSCTISFGVSGTPVGSYVNTITAGALVTSNGTNALAASATLVIDYFPTLVKSFSPALVGVGANSVLTITLGNLNAAPATLTANLVDFLPVGLVLSSPATTCVGGSGVTAVGNALTLGSGAVIPAAGSCVVTVNVSSPITGFFANGIIAGGLVTNLGSNIDPAVATLSVVAVGIAKSFTPDRIRTCDRSVLTITLSNPFATAATNASFFDEMPRGLETCDHVVNTCGGFAHADHRSISLFGGSIPAGGFCTVSLEVSAEECGAYFNVIPVGALTSQNGPSVAGAHATLRVFD